MIRKVDKTTKKERKHRNPADKIIYIIAMHVKKTYI